MTWSKFIISTLSRDYFYFCAFLDPFIGASPFKGNEYLPVTYKGTIYVLQTKPVGAFPDSHITEEDIEEAWVFDGAWPISLPFDTITSDLATADSAQLTVNFAYDGYPMKSSEGAIEACLAAYRELGHNTLMDTYKRYLTYPDNSLDGTSRIGGNA